MQFNGGSSLPPVRPDYAGLGLGNSAGIPNHRKAKVDDMSSGIAPSSL
jgi:hypothetical protein